MSTTLRLRALDGEPLGDDAVARTVIATAYAIAERTGVPLESIEHDARSLTVRIGAPELQAVAFLAELRRILDVSITPELILIGFANIQTTLMSVFAGARLRCKITLRV